jgi:Holliday junction resolvasome RuvABC endonuclease subunit
MELVLPYRIFAVDPATGKSGWAVLDIVSLHPLEINIVKTGQLDGDKLFRLRKEMALIFGRQFSVLDALFSAYCELITEHNPNCVVSEGAFGYNHMSAYIAISMAIYELRRAAHVTINQDVIQIPPTISKKSATGSGGADKDLMRLAYQTSEFLKGIVADDLISEHEIDAIWHGVGFIMRDVLKRIVHISAKEAKAAKRLKQKEKESKG